MQQIPPILRPDFVKPVSLVELSDAFELDLASGSAQGQVTGLSMNTADLRPGDLFVAMPGLKTHGAKFAAAALEAGAAAIITDRAGIELMQELGAVKTFATVFLLEEPRLHLGKLAAYVYGNTSGERPKMFATTGTNGKTSTSYLLEAILRQLGEVTGLTTTAERHIAGEVIVSRLTTPESTEMNALIARMREKHCTSIVIEVSAQALTQRRVDGLFFDSVGFTNLSHDHLDDYADLSAYLSAKAELFTPGRATQGVVSLDSASGENFLALSKIPCQTISSTNLAADWQVKITAELPGRTEFELTAPTGEKLTSHVPILGAHMAANAGLAIAMLVQAGFEFEAIASAIAKGVDAYLPGRTERVSASTGPEVYVDFGHSPDAFLNTLSAVRKVTNGKVIMVFGADGDRDATKRPAMASVAALGSDILVITDHHPRFEDPESIRQALVESAKLARPDLELYEVSPPEAAIRKAVSLAKPGDAILWAGPGHQDYRDIRGVRTPYSARKEARDALAESGWK